MHLHKKGTVSNLRHLLVTWHYEGIIKGKYTDEDAIWFPWTLIMKMLVKYISQC